MARGRRDKPQFSAGVQHPPRYRGDLSPNAMAGQNAGQDRGPKEQGRARSAYDLKAVHRALHELPDDELKQVPVLDEGERLGQGATYFDLAHPERGEQTGTGDRAAAPGEWLVPKAFVAYWLYNRLRGVTDERRLDAGPRGEGGYEGHV